MTDTVKHMWDQVEKARADGTFSSEHAAVPAQDASKRLKLAEKYARILDRAKTMRRSSMQMRVFEDDMECIIAALRAPVPIVPTGNPSEIAERLRWEALESSGSTKGARKVMLAGADEIDRLAVAPRTPAGCADEADQEAVYDLLYANVYADDDGVAGLSAFVEELFKKYDVRPK